MCYKKRHASAIYAASAISGCTCSKFAVTSKAQLDVYNRAFYLLRIIQNNPGTEYSNFLSDTLTWLWRTAAAVDKPTAVQAAAFAAISNFPLEERIYM